MKDIAPERRRLGKELGTINMSLLRSEGRICKELGTINISHLRSEKDFVKELAAINIWLLRNEEIMDLLHFRNIVGSFNTDFPLVFFPYNQHRRPSTLCR